jgi:predicted dehydrogenase
VPGARLVGVCDERRDRAERVAAQLGTRAFSSVERLLDEAEAVSVAVPTRDHHGIAMVALARGRHVLIEKPIAATIPEAESLVLAAERAGVVLQSGHVERFNRALRAAAPFLSSPLSIRSERLAPFQVRGTDVAVVTDLMIHDLDLVLMLVREPVADVRASCVGLLPSRVDAVTARIAFASGVVAQLTASRLAPSRVRRFRIVQATGTLALDLVAGRGEFRRVRPGVAGGPAQVERIVLEATEAEPLRLELESFVRAVRTGGAPAVSGRDGIAALDLAFRVLDAAGCTPALATA